MSIADFLAASRVEDAVFEEYPDYVAQVIVATNLTSGPTSEHSDALLRDAEEQARQLLAGRPPQELPEVQTWRDAYGSFGVKPRDARSSIEALLRRVDEGLPRINRLTDIYNAISVRYLIPIGGEDLGGYDGPARLVVADGTETFDTIADGEPMLQTVAAGEVVWRDDTGVTCRRWNWRQCVRTRLTESTTEAIFILDGLGADADRRTSAAMESLLAQLSIESPEAAFESKTISAD